MKKWLISILAAGVALLASTAFADGSITLSPDGSTSTDTSVRIDGQNVTITQAGTYQIAGTLGDGALIVESAENAKIALVLGGVSIKNSTGAAIQIATADDVTIELSEGRRTSCNPARKWTLPLPRRAKKHPAARCKARLT